MNAQDIIRLLLVTSVMLLVLGVGMQGKWSDVTYARRHPDLLWRGFACVNVLVPAVAVILCLLVPIPFPIKVAIVLMSVSPPAPFAPGKMLKTGADIAFVNGLYIVLILSAIVIIPISLALINLISPHHVEVPDIKLTAFIVITMLIPLLIGLGIATKWSEFAKRAAPKVNLVAFAILVPVSLLIVFKKIGAVAALVGNGSVATIAAVVCAGILGGYLLGGRSAEHRAAMGQVAATRHPGIAAIIAKPNFTDPQVLMAIALFLLTSMVISTAYAAWERKAAERGKPAKA